LQTAHIADYSLDRAKPHPRPGDGVAYVFAAVHAELSAREIVEALQVIGFYWAFGRVATVLQVEIEPDHGTAVVQASASEKLTGGEQAKAVPSTSCPPAATRC
jgi:hypothetical protein